MAVHKYYNTWVDSSGNFLLTTYSYAIAGLTPVSALNPSMRDLSNAAFTGFVHSPIDTSQNQEAGVAVYPSVFQQANMVFGDDVGGTANVVIPAPRSAIFLPDGITVDVTNIDVALFLVAAIASNNLITSTGSVATTFLRGFRVGRGAGA